MWIVLIVFCKERRVAMGHNSNESLFFADMYRNTKIFLSGQNIFLLPCREREKERH